MGGWAIKKEAGHWTSLEAGPAMGGRIPSCLPFSVANQFAMACGCQSIGSGAPSTAYGKGLVQARRLGVFGGWRPFPFV